MDQPTAITRLVRALQFRKHVKELTSACKRINKDGCYEFVTYRHASSTETLSKIPPAKKKQPAKFDGLRSKIHNYKRRSKSACRLSTRVRPHVEETTTSSNNNDELPSAIPTATTFYDHLSRSTSILPANLLMIVSQSYKPLHAKSTQFNNKNTIAVTKDSSVKALYASSNWVFVEVIDTGERGFVPVYCLRLPESSYESSSQNNLSLLNVSIYEKPRRSRVSITNNNRSTSTSTPPSPGRFISSIGPCHFNHIEQQISRSTTKTATFTRQIKDQSILSRQISNISLHAYDQDAYGTLNLTPNHCCKSLSFSILDTDPTPSIDCRRLRVIDNYQRRFVGDVSVLESEVVTLVGTAEADGDWRLIRRGDGRQGYIPKQIVVPDRYIN